MGFPTFLTFVVAAGAVVFGVPNPPAFSALVWAEIVFDTAELRAIMVTLAGSGLSNNSPQTIPAGSLNLSGVLWKRSTFFAPWRSSALNSAQPSSIFCIGMG